MDLTVTAARLTGDTAHDIKALANHVFQLEELLRYELRNLDVTNFNDLGLARYENGRLQIFSKQVKVQTDKLRVEFGEETDEIYANISATAEELMAEIEDANGNYTSLKTTVNGIQTTVSGHTTSIGNLQSSISQTDKKISAVVSAVDDSSGNVTAASIVAAINKAGSEVKISADHIVLTGVVTIDDLGTSGKVMIDAGNIQAGGTLEGVGLVSNGDAYWQEVRIENGQIYTFSGGMFDNGYGEMELYSSDTLHMMSYEGYVRIYPGTTSYWEFRPSGIYWVDRYGDVLNRVALNSDLP